jgi:cytochrome c oxidase subunit I
MYLYAVFFWFVVAMIIGLLLRTELMGQGHTIMGPNMYNSLFTLHGVIMIFLFVIPAIPAIFGNFLLPIQLGTDDVFFPRLNLFSWYLFMFGGIFALVALFAGDGFPDTGWTFYVPFSVESSSNVGLTVGAAFILGMSSMLTGLNFVTTFHRMRDKRMGLMQIPLFTWSLYATAWVQILATPVISITFVLVVMERLLSIGLFDPAKGGDPILYQHLFWMYSHPAVYIMILPGMGVISEIIPVFSRKSIFGYKAIVWSSMGIAIAGSLVWAHHMYTSGMSDVSVFVFSLLTFLVAIPSAVKVFSWVATMYKGSIEMTPPLLLSLIFIYLFSVGGLTGWCWGRWDRISMSMTPISSSPTFISSCSAAPASPFSPPSISGGRRCSASCIPFAPPMWGRSLPPSAFSSTMCRCSFSVCKVCRGAITTICRNMKPATSWPVSAGICSASG